MPRCKRSACDSGLHVPLIVYIPPRFRELAPQDYAPGGKSERLTSFVDLAPTLLSLAGIRPPSGWKAAPSWARTPAPNHPAFYGLRGRMDERIDLVRSVRDHRYVYVRNFMPHRRTGSTTPTCSKLPRHKSGSGSSTKARSRPPRRITGNPRRPRTL
jgi:uncharacterized sulfatase